MHQGYEHVETSRLSSGCTTSDSPCTCDDSICTSDSCECSRLNEYTMYSPNEWVLLPLAHDIDFSGVIYECGPRCPCKGGPNCQGSVIAKGVVRRLKLSEYPNKGYGVQADEDIPKGAWICEYAGEYLTNDQANARLQQYDADKSIGGHALLVVRLWLPQLSGCLRVNVDATKVGNIARFLNHSCDGGNLEVVLIYRTGEAAVPRIGLFSKKNILKGSELTYSYGKPNGGEGLINKEEKRCFCGSDSCLGYLPSDASVVTGNK